MYPHGSNIRNKINQNYNGHGAELESFFRNQYLHFRNTLSALDCTTKEGIESAVDELNKYYALVEEAERSYKITSQSKFRSTVLEEFNVYLFKDVPSVRNWGLDFFNKGIYAGLKINSSGNISVITKDVDFCIGKRFSLTMGTSAITIILPVVAVEVKTYLDATMFNEVQFSAKTIKNASPNASLYVIMERNEVREEVINSAKADTPLHEMFVVRDPKTGMVDTETIKEYYNDVVNSMMFNVNQTLKYPGRLFNR